MDGIVNSFISSVGFLVNEDRSLDLELDILDI